MSLGISRPILQQFADKLTAEIKVVIPHVSGKTSESVQPHVYEGGFMIDANASLVTLITGRKPTGYGPFEKKETLQQKILVWMDLKGIQGHVDTAGKFISQNSISWAIANSIHRNGNKLYQSKGYNNLFEKMLNPQRIDSLIDALGMSFQQEIKSDIIKELND